MVLTNIKAQNCVCMWVCTNYKCVWKYVLCIVVHECICGSVNAWSVPRYVVCLHKSRGVNVCLSACTLFTHQIMFTTSLHTVDKLLISKRVHCCALEKPRLYIGRDSQYTSVAISLQMREVGSSHVLVVACHELALGLQTSPVVAFVHNGW